MGVSQGNHSHHHLQCATCHAIVAQTLVRRIMAETRITLTLPLSPYQGWVLVTVAGIAALSIIVYFVLRVSPPSSRRKHDWSRGAVEALFWAFSPIWVALVGLVLFHFWELLATLPEALKDRDSLRTYATAFGGLIAALGALATLPFALIRVYTTERQTRTAEQGHITDRISKAVEQLGAERTVKTPGRNAGGIEITMESTEPDIVVRIGGIYALERIADDSSRDQIRVLELLNDYLYVRNMDRDTKDLNNADGVPISPKDMVVIAKILARNNWNRL